MTYRNLPIKQKLRLIIMFTVVLTLVLACAAILVSDQIAYRAEMRNSLGILAEIFGSNNTAALSFGDQSAAENLLAGLHAKTSIVAAFLYSAAGCSLAIAAKRSQISLQPPPYGLKEVGSRGRDSSCSKVSRYRANALVPSIWSPTWESCTRGSRHCP